MRNCDRGFAGEGDAGAVTSSERTCAEIDQLRAIAETDESGCGNATLMTYVE